MASLMFRSFDRLAVYTENCGQSNLQPYCNRYGEVRIIVIVAKAGIPNELIMEKAGSPTALGHRARK